jgi:phage-related minor tail protein
MTHFDDGLSLANAQSDVAALTTGLADASRAGAQLGRSLTVALTDLVVRGRDVSDVFGKLALSLSQTALKAAFQPLEAGIGNLFTGLLKGGALPFARGAALAQGTPIPFAHGGVVASPTTFPLADGRTGLMGEAGAEAILPLRRGADGRLGVAASHAGSAAPITINITATDIESFRRSETQVAALLARAVARGQRNL